MTLSPDFDARVRASARDARAADVLALSDFYLAHPGRPTPWDETFCAPAYLAYFLPLNYARVRACLAELKRFVAPGLIRQVVDFGSGVGTVHWALEDEGWLEPRELVCSERSAAAVRLHERLIAAAPTRWRPRFEKSPRVADGALGVFSYAFLEMQDALPALDRFDHLLIIEPSTRDCGRQLMAWRQKLIDRGFSALAPCTHDLACPLLTDSPRDWCHMRIAFEAPAWWRELEAELPMTNRTLTYSYLLMSRVARDARWRGEARVIGDTLRERGKTRQMICRGPKREFLSWLTKHGEPPRIPHGALVRGTRGLETKGGGEVRVDPDVTLEVDDGV